MPSVVPVVVNPAARAGGAGKATARALAALHDLGARPAPLRGRAASSAEDAAAEVARLTAAGCERIVVLGGDGLIHHLLPAVVGTRTVVGIVPVGTGNDLVAALGLPRDPAAAAQAALGPGTALDAIELGAGRLAATIATTGFSAAVNARANQLSWPQGPSRYTVATLACLPAMRARPIRLTLQPSPPATNATSVELRAALVAVANTSSFGGGMRIAPDADPTDGQLDVVVIGEVGPAQLLWSFARVFGGTHLSHPAVSSCRAAAVTLASTDETLEVWADGEQVGPLPRTLSTRPGAWLVASARAPAAGRR